MNYLTPSDINQNDVLSTNKPVFSILKKNGYDIVIVPCHYAFLSGANIADKTITTDPRIIAITQNVDFLRSTVLSLYEGIIRPYLYFSNEEVNKIFKNDSSKSKFVFIHALNLHDYAYDKKCEIISSVQRDTQELSFLHHLHCMNTFVEKIVSTLQKNDPNSIIIVQGDHSPSKWMVEESGESPKSKTEFKRIFSIFSAVYIDGLHPHSEIATYLSGTPTPINNFRIIFSYLSEIKPQFLEHRFFDFYFHELTDIYNSSYEVQHLKAL